MAEEGSALMGIVAELMAEDAEGARGVTEAAGDVGRWLIVDEEGADGLILALHGELGERKNFRSPGVVI